MFDEVSKWLNLVLEQDIPEEVVAFCFNLYEDGENSWSMELVGTERFDADDEDWPCDEITDFDTRKEPFAWEKAVEWEKALEAMIGVLTEYLENGKFADVLKSKAGVGVGFVDGDIEILYTKQGAVK